MNTALVLLLLLAVAAIPGSLVPQRSADPNGVVQYFTRDPNGARILDALSLFDVYTSPWFSAIYLLLTLSLVGCLVPRIRHHVKALMAPPPRTPKNLDRLPAHAVASTQEPLSDVLQNAQYVLRRSRYRVRTYADPESDEHTSIAAERGYLRETGNIVFHVAITVVIIALAVGSGLRHTGQRVLVEGQSFTNTRLAYDSYSAGPLVKDDDLTPFTLTLDRLTVTYVTDNLAAFGTPSGYDAKIAVTRPGGGRTASAIQVNNPLDVDGTNIYLLGNGYAPRIIVKNAEGTVVFDDTIPFLPQDANLTSLGVVKVPDGLKKQIGMVGFLYPSRVTKADGASASALPVLANPVVTLNVYSGDLGLDNSTASNAYRLDTTKMTQLAGPKLPTKSLMLTPGTTQQLPNGLGSIEMPEIRRFASFELTYDPVQGVVLGAALIILLGLGAALFVPRRRLWVRLQSTPGGVEIEVAGLSRGRDPGLNAAVRDVIRKLTPTSPRKENP